MTQLGTLQGDGSRGKPWANVVTVRRLSEVDNLIDGPRSVDFAHLRLGEERTAVGVFERGRSWLEADDHGGRVQHDEAGHRATSGHLVPVGATCEQH